jgi:hypothetical protein
MKVAFIAKTDLATDGRILNQIRMLNEKFGNELTIHFILFPDRPFEKDNAIGFHLHTIKTIIRNNRVFRFFTVVDFTFRAFLKLLFISPNLLHIHDSAVILPALFYKGIRRKRIITIYDDHELPNENQSIGHHIFNYLELKTMQVSDFVLFANHERLLYAKENFTIKGPSSYFLNLPFYDFGQVELSSEESLILEDIDTFISRGHKFIIHQGVINIERVESKLARFSSILKPPYKILIIGASRRNFDSFIEKYNLEASSFYFVGKVRYNVLNFFWKRGIASVVMYAPTLLNNRLCAPNRFYISLNSGLPVFINKDNLVLQNLIREFQCGYEIESFGMDFDFERIEGVQPLILNGFSELKKNQALQFLNVYQNLMRFSKS